MDNNNSNGVMLLDCNNMTNNDAAWILSNAFRIMTMQSGFALLEAGYVSSKNIANIMVKNMVDIVLGGLGYWSFGYGFSFGQPSNPFCGFGDFFLLSDKDRSGPLFTHYIYQLCFATTATTIISGAVAERIKLSAYMAFATLNTLVYVFPASWSWNRNGFLKSAGFHDFAGGCIVHVVGGASAMVAAKILGPRIGRFSETDKYGMSSPVTALTGTFMLWWGWLAFNCGSTQGIQGDLWKIAAKVGVNTMNSSIGGCLVSILVVAIRHRGRHYDINYFIMGILGGLVAITAGCAVLTPHESLLVGILGSLVAISFHKLMEVLKVDDPVGATPVHLGAGLIGTICVGIFANDEYNLITNNGLIHGGGYYLLAVQFFGVLLVAAWSMATTAIIVFLIDKTIGLRVSVDEEILGADFLLHGVKQADIAAKYGKGKGKGGKKTNTVQNGNEVPGITSFEGAVERLLADLQQSRSSEETRRTSVKPYPNTEVLALASLVREMEQPTASGLRGIPHQDTITALQLPGIPEEFSQEN